MFIYILSLFKVLPVHTGNTVQVPYHSGNTKQDKKRIEIEIEDFIHGIINI